jgi:hypothetical protein
MKTPSIFRFDRKRRRPEPAKTALTPGPGSEHVSIRGRIGRAYGVGTIMIFKKLGLAAALSLASVSTGAVAQSAQPLSLANAPAVRAGAHLRGESNIRGGFILPTLVLIAIGVAIWQLTKSKSP